MIDGLINFGDAHGSLLAELSSREVEVLRWMAKDFRNDTIALVLSREVRTVGRHINSIYGKHMIDYGSEDPRVTAALKHLQATDSLPKEPKYED